MIKKSKPLSIDELAKELGLKETRRSSSINAKEVARDVIAHVRAGKKVNMQKIQKAHGYTAASAKSMKATQTKAYKEEMFDYVASMKTLREKTINALQRKDLDEAKLFDLNLLLKNLNHDIQLVEGKATENVNHQQNIVVYGSEDFLAMQLNKGLVKP